MRIGVMSVFVDYHRRGAKNRVSLQAQIGPLIAGLLPRDIEIDIVNGTWQDPDWQRDYDLLFISALHSDFDRARQISHYWRRRGAKTVCGGPFASGFPELCRPWFDTIVVGHPEETVPAIYRDCCARRLAPRYESRAYQASQVATPRYETLLGKSINPLVLEASRGCPFTCEFCVLTGLGTRYHPRPVADVLRDIVAGQQLVDPGLPFYKRRMVGFTDNNLGSFSWLRELCAALEPLNVQWYSAASFNVVANRDLVALMSCSGCRGLFVGLETCNPRELVNSINALVEALEGLFNELRDISKIDAGVIKPNFAECPLGRVLDRLRLDFQPLAAEKGLQLPCRTRAATRCCSSGSCAISSRTRSATRARAACWSRRGAAPAQCPSRCGTPASAFTTRSWSAFSRSSIKWARVGWARSGSRDQPAPVRPPGLSHPSRLSTRSRCFDLKCPRCPRELSRRSHRERPSCRKRNWAAN